jgi:hypothetical protein
MQTAAITKAQNAVRAEDAALEKAEKDAAKLVVQRHSRGNRATKRLKRAIVSCIHNHAVTNRINLCQSASMKDGPSSRDCFNSSTLAASSTSSTALIRYSVTPPVDSHRVAHTCEKSDEALSGSYTMGNKVYQRSDALLKDTQKVHDIREHGERGTNLHLGVDVHPVVNCAVQRPQTVSKLSAKKTRFAKRFACRTVSNSLQSVH